MPWVICPACEDPERTIRLEEVGGYEWDTGAGPFIEPQEIICGCELTGDQWEEVDRRAAALDMHEWVPDEP